MWKSCGGKRAERASKTTAAARSKVVRMPSGCFLVARCCSICRHRHHHQRHQLLPSVHPLGTRLWHLERQQPQQHRLVSGAEQEQEQQQQRRPRAAARW